MKQQHYFLTVGISQGDTVRDIRALAEAGADEFYCGIVPEDWQRVYGFQISPNRREFKINQYLFFNSLQEAVGEAHALGKKVFVTFNASYYVDRMYPFLLRYIDRLEAMRVDGLIVSDLGLILALKKRGTEIPLVLSGEAGVYNSESLGFFLSLGVKRIIFPRHLTVGEIEALVAGCPSKDTEFEVFIHSQRCPYNSDVCTTSHGWEEVRFCFTDYEKRLCRKNPDGGSADGSGADSFFEAETDEGELSAWRRNREDYDLFTRINSYAGHDACGICAAGRFIAAGVRHFKIVSRGTGLDDRLLLLRGIKANIGGLLSDPAENPRRGIPREFCELKYGCYYREF